MLPSQSSPRLPCTAERLFNGRPGLGSKVQTFQWRQSSSAEDDCSLPLGLKTCWKRAWGSRDDFVSLTSPKMSAAQCLPGLRAMSSRWVGRPEAGRPLRRRRRPSEPWQRGMKVVQTSIDVLRAKSFRAGVSCGHARPDSCLYMHECTPKQLFVDSGGLAFLLSHAIHVFVFQTYMQALR